MTHERRPNEEAPAGPEHDDTLPDADEIPVADGPFDLDPVDRPEHWKG